MIASLKIDLPVVEQPSGYPYCNVAMWLPQLARPGLPGATYIFAHPRAGMFLPLLRASQVSSGKALKGKRVEVYTSADWLFTYSITEVHRHVAPDRHALDGPRSATSPELWLQTGEGGYATSPVLQIMAILVSANPASHAAAQPSPKIVVCQ